MNLPKAMSLKTNSITYVALLLLTSDGFSPRATSTSPNSQSSKMNSIVYQKQFQSAPATVRMTQPFPTQFAPQVGRYKWEISITYLQVIANLANSLIL